LRERVLGSKNSSTGLPFNLKEYDEDGDSILIDAKYIKTVYQIIK